MKKAVKWLSIVLILFVAGLASLLFYWYLRPNGAMVDKTLAMESWDAVNDGTHNSNTDLVYLNGSFYLVHASSPYHFASEKCRLVVRRSKDARQWEKLSEVNVPGEDIRDPKFAVIGNRIILYVLKSVDFEAEPYKTAYLTSTDAVTWSPMKDIEPDGWLFWRPKTRDGRTWYVPAYWHEHNKSILLKSTDGKKWSIVSQVYEGDRNDETDIEFLQDGRMIATARLEVSDSWTGHRDASTLIAVANPPYVKWNHVKSRVTRLDGPSLFSYRNKIYAVGRHNPDTPGPLFYYGSILARKRTALYRVLEDRLVYLTDLPSAGDTSYSGVVMRGDDLYVSYYTSDIKKDYPWIMGMFLESAIRIAKISLPSLEAVADARIRKESRGH